MRKLSFLAICGLCAIFVPGRAEDFEFFEKKIRPILTEHCYPCHSAEAEKVKGELLLDSKQGMLKGGQTGPTIVPGSSEKSLLITAVRYGDKDLQMPPKGKKLAESQINDLVEWVKMGAPDPRTGETKPKTDKAAYDFAAARMNWAFHTPADPPIPKIAHTRQAQSPIDHFILAKLEEHQLEPAAPADKRTLIRRATFDLTGLPPTPAEIDAFLADKSKDAYPKLIDRLLASPHYGERWGRHWLDVVRYADSVDARVTGGAEDFAESWRYRDWVVNSFNRDLPYDQFVMQQIAGDLLPTSEPESFDTNAVIATGIYAIGNWGNGDADKDKILTDIADDAVDVTGRAFLGLTLACARCHDHKFDPIPTADYYSLAGIFFSSHIIPKLSPKGAGETMLRIPLISKAETERREKREKRIEELESKIEEIQDKEISALAKQALPLTEKYLAACLDWRNATSTNSPSLSELVAKRQLDVNVLQRWLNYFDSSNVGLLSTPIRELPNGKGLQAWRNAAGADNPSIIANGTDLEATFLTVKLPAHRLAVHPSPKDGVSAGWKSPITGRVQIQGQVVDVDPNCGDGVEWELVKTTKGNPKTIIHSAIASGGREELTAKNGPLIFDVNPGDFLQINVFPQGGYECDATMVEMEITEKSSAKRTWNINHDVSGDLLTGNPHADSFGNADVWYFRDLAQKTLTAPTNSSLAAWFEILNDKQSPDEKTVKEVAARVQKEITALDQTNKIYQAFIEPRGAFWAPLRNNTKLFSAETQSSFQRLKTELSDLRQHPPAPIAMANGLQEGGVPESSHAGIHDVKIHMRGRYDKLGDLVPRRFPRLLAGENQAPITGGSGRLQLAKWIANTNNPLTARVIINRIWQQHFGEGIVRTPNNYGKLGTPPSHPGLLDYLTHRFIDSGWSIKAMHRAIMLSATYQQSCVANRTTLKADPDNKWFGRMNRRRLDAESLRDSVLLVADKLDRSFGGPAIRDLDSGRRTIYLMSVRSDRSNYKTLFDAADPNSIVEQRAVSTVAPQALFLMNHPFMLAQTETLAEHVGTLKSTKEKQKIEWLYRSLYGREPSYAEIKIGHAALAQARESSNDEKSAWTQYCQVLLCANEFVYVD